jgi:cell division septation protein DedD
VILAVITVGDNSRRRASPGGDDRPVSAWAVQAGAFAAEENATRLRDRLAERFPTPWTEESDGLSRVKFGPYRSKADAEAARDSLADLGLAGILVPYR